MNMANIEILQNAATPLRKEQYQLHPLGLLASYRDVGTPVSYVREPGKHLWKAIVTDYLPASGPGAPAIFDIVGGMAISHTQVAEMARLEKEPVYRLGNADVQLRLEAEEQTTTLRAEVCSRTQLDATSLDLAASLLQAGMQIPSPFPGQTFDTLEIKVFSGTSQAWRIRQDDSGTIIANALDYDER